MKFERQLLGARVEAWKQYYIDYSGLRSVLERLFAGVDVPVPVHTRQRLRSQFEQVTQRRHTLIVDATRSARSASALYQPVPASRLPIDLTTVVEMGDVESSSILHSAAQSPALSRSSSPPIEAETTPNSSVSRTPQPLLRALTTLPRPSDYDEPSELVEAREEFFAALNEEVAKIDFFYRREESRAAAALDALNTQTLNTDDEVTGNAMRVIKDSWVNLFRRLVMLQNFAKLNQIGFVEILGEFERMTHTYWPDAEEFLHDLATNVHFTTSQVMDELIDRTITTYADAFFGGDTSAARIRLLAKMTKTQRNRNEYMQLGLKMGTCMSLIVWCVVALSTQADELSGQGGMVPVFRGFFLCIVELYLYAWSTFIWHKHRINFVFMLQLSPTTRLSTLDVLDQATGMLLVFCISTLMFAYSVGFGVGVPSLVFPFVIFIFFTAKLFMPFMSVWQTRRVLLDSIFQTLISPFGRVGFREAFVADIVSSMSRVLIDIYYSSCFFVTGVWISDQASDNACQSTTNVAVPILATLPLYWRLAQNLRRWYDTRQAWPHAANAAKFGYTLALVVMGSFQSVVEVARDDAWSPLKAAWMFMFVSSTLLSWLWDVIVDWGLFRKGGSWLLRPVLLFRRSWYYAAIVVDFFLRFCWSVSILPFAFIVVSGKYRESVILPVIYSLELARRFVWSIIRVENEQLHNPERFRPQTFVPVHFDTAKEHSRREQSYKSNVRTVLEFTFLGVLVVLIALVAAVL